MEEQPVGDATLYHDSILSRKDDRPSPIAITLIAANPIATGVFRVLARSPSPWQLARSPGDRPREHPATLFPDRAYL